MTQHESGGLAADQEQTDPAGWPATGAPTSHRAEPAPPSPRAMTLSVATVSTALLVAVAMILPVPYAVSSPGPTRDTLGEHEGSPLITIEGVPTYESTGELRLTTVSVAGGPAYPVTLSGLVRGWLDPARAVRPVEEVFSPDESRDAIDARNVAAMVSSQEYATVAALEELGYEVPTVLRVGDTVEGTGADGVLRAEDVIVEIEGVGVPSFSVLSEQMDAVDPGATITVAVDRDGARHELEVTTVEDEGRALLGVLIDPQFELPVDVTIDIDSIGGPSAGSMFALGIIDLLTEEDEANGVAIAGTGTIDLSGRIGAIGGIRQKLHGATRDGATWFLAPSGNCDEVVGHIPDGLSVTPVATLAQARAAVEAIGAGEGADLPTCDQLA
ncbi:S16 family serine protease [Actinotalea sp. K2]|uniref:YlbL family protein n=1 Tax=Actinotalea sp. K2 TaxID=2939438 RepID=UPI002017492B|nr:S16 family serine protease [Actinotalea sp. K2]MCL3859847.1 signal protein PDZ [Actinotalea sp. K2]